MFNDLLHVLSQCCEKYPQEIKWLIARFKKICRWFRPPRRSYLWFQRQALQRHRTVLKISNLDEGELNVLNTVQVHNLGEEHNVGLFNYEISIRGKKNFKIASRKLVLNKSNDLIFNTQTNTYKNFRKAAKEITANKLESKMLKLQEKGYSEKAILNTKIESQKCKTWSI